MNKIMDPLCIHINLCTTNTDDNRKKRKKRKKNYMHAGIIVLSSLLTTDTCDNLHLLKKLSIIGTGIARLSKKNFFLSTIIETL